MQSYTAYSKMYSELIKFLDSKKVQLVAVSKTQPLEKVQKVYDLGQRTFGENRVQELMGKKDLLPTDIEWHLIGHLQKNKVKFIAPFISMIHSVDSVELAQVISKEAVKNNRIIPVLLQVKIAIEEAKYGFDPLLIEDSLGQLRDLPGIDIQGMMGMGTFTSDQEITLQEFQKMSRIYKEIKAQHFADVATFKELSMGMSGDYKLAIEEGSTMVRVGSLLFNSIV